MLKKIFVLPVLICLVGTAIGCKKDDKKKVAAIDNSVRLTGTVATGAAVASTVYIKDAAGNVVTGETTVTGDTETDGKYSIVVEGLTPPFVILAQNTVLNINLYSVAYQSGTANVTPATNVMVGLIFKSDPEILFPPAQMVADNTPITALTLDVAAIKEKITEANDILKTVLAPLITADPNMDFLGAAFDANGSGLDSILDAVKMDIDSSASVSFTFNGTEICDIDASAADIASEVTSAATAVNVIAVQIIQTINHNNTTAGDDRAQDGIEGVAHLIEHLRYSDISSKTERIFEDARNANGICDYNDYKKVRDCFSDSVLNDDTNAKGNLGMALCDILDLNYKPTTWKILDQLMHHKSYSAITVSAADVKTLCNVDAVGAISSAIARLNLVLTSSFTSVTVNEIVLDDEDEAESFVITKAEVYVMKAALEVLRAAIYVAMSYDIQPVGADGTYGWMIGLTKEYDDYDWMSWDSYTTSTSGTGQNTVTLTKNVEEEEAANGVLIFRALKLNWDKASYGTINSDNKLASAKTDLIQAVADLKSALTVVKAQTGDVSKNLITQSDIDDINEDLAEDFAKEDVSHHYPGETLNSCEAILNFANKVLTTQVTIALDPESGTAMIPVTIDASKFFSGSITSIKSFLPYLRWRAESAWIETETDRWVHYYGHVYTSATVTQADQQAWWLATYGFTPSYNDVYYSDEYLGDNRWNLAERWVDDPEVNDPSGDYNWWLYNSHYINVSGVYNTLGSVLADDYEVSKIVKIETGYDVEPIDLTTAAGVVIDMDADDAYPEFPDYTFAGIFPGMTKAKFESLD